MLILEIFYRIVNVRLVVCPSHMATINEFWQSIMCVRRQGALNDIISTLYFPDSNRVNMHEQPAAEDVNNTQPLKQTTEM